MAHMGLTGKLILGLMAMNFVKGAMSERKRQRDEDEEEDLDDDLDDDLPPRRTRRRRIHPRDIF